MQVRGRSENYIGKKQKAEERNGRGEDLVNFAEANSFKIMTTFQK